MKIDDLSKTKRDIAIETAKEALMLGEKLEFIMLDMCPETLLDAMTAKNREKIEKARAFLSITNIMKAMEAN